MVVLHAAMHLAASVLVLSGLAKILRPGGVVPALRALRLPASRSAGRAIGAGEALLGGAALVTSDVAALAAGTLAWAALAGAAAALARQPSADCGCFGADEGAPVTRAHVAGNVLATLAFAASVLDPGPTVADLARTDGVLAVATYVVLLAAGAAAVATILTAPEPLRAAPRPAPPARPRAA